MRAGGKFARPTPTETGEGYRWLPGGCQRCSTFGAEVRNWAGGNSYFLVKHASFLLGMGWWVCFDRLCVVFLCVWQCGAFFWNC